MKVMCRANTGSVLPKESLDFRVNLTSETEFPVTVGSEYAVFAITVLRGLPWYYIVDDDDLRWPTWTPASLFDVVDPSIPNGWEFGYHTLPTGGTHLVISFPEWARDWRYYERLLDDDLAALRVFDVWRTKLSREDTAAD